MAHRHYPGITSGAARPAAPGARRTAPSPPPLMVVPSGNLSPDGEKHGTWKEASFTTLLVLLYHTNEISQTAPNRRMGPRG